MEPEETSITRQRLGKQVSSVKDTQATIEEMLETMFSIRSVQSGYKQEFSWEWSVHIRKRQTNLLVREELAVHSHEDMTRTDLFWIA
jgi:hypothetical protein